MKSWLAAATLLLGLMPAAVPAAYAESYPAKPVRLLVPASAGGVTDLIARIAADYLSAKLKQQFVVENRTGSGGNVATEALARAEADGYTLGLLASGNVVINPFIYKMQIDAKTDLLPVASIAEAPQVLAVNKDVPAGSLKELIALAKDKPNSFSYATAGVGTSMHLAGDQFARLAGLQLVHVPYRGAAPAVTDVVSGTVQIIPVSAGPIMGFVQSGQLRVLAAASSHRLKHFPAVPTSSEAGLRGYEMTTWFGVFAPKGTPDAIVTSLQQAMSEMLVDPVYAKRLEDNFLDLMPMSQRQFADFVAAEFPKWEMAVRQAGVKVEY
jgi:tripartite-type tricarboxylate transporter receptor subunit TctC